MLQKNTELKSLIKTIDELSVQENEALLFFFGEESTVDYAKLISYLNKSGIVFLGGIFPGIIHGEDNLTSGCIIKKLKYLHPPVLIRGLESNHIAVPDFSTVEEQATFKPTMLTIVDGLTKNIANCLNELHNVLGNFVNFVGGGAGSLSLQQQPCILSSEGLVQDAAIVCTLAYEVQLGVRHGWQQLNGPVVATRTQSNEILELNWRPALDVYKSVVEQDYNEGRKKEEKEALQADNFFEIAKCYPFGIYREGQEDIVRDPIMVGEGNSLICVGEVPENTVLNILKGEVGHLIQSAQNAIQDTIVTEAAADRLRHTLVFDCISRTLFLEGSFEEELAVINQKIKSRRKEVTPQGVLSLGEISSYGEGMLEFFNKTIVIGTLYRDV